MPQSEIGIRRAEDIDLEPLLELFLRYRAFYQVEARKEASSIFLANNLRDPGVLLLLAEQDGVLLGFAQVYRGRCSLELAPLWTLYDLFVAPSARRKGVAQALMSRVDQLASSEGVARLELATAHDNTSAQALYRAQGWTPEKTFQIFVRTPGS